MATVKSQVDKNLSELEGQLELWSAKLDEAVAIAKGTGRQAKIDSRKQIEELSAKLDAARKLLDEGWDDIKEGVEDTWYDLEAAFKNLGRSE